mmetsp:Transcript_43522/g.65959  ORF Transcript_43522/g.65959 Transcript_43522/m.65959 type:complete len:124 (-) Transcript_43522:629-1000(-)
MGRRQWRVSRLTWLQQRLLQKRWRAKCSRRSLLLRDLDGSTILSTTQSTTRSTTRSTILSTIRSTIRSTTRTTPTAELLSLSLPPGTEEIVELFVSLRIEVHGLVVLVLIGSQKTAAGAKLRI